MRRNSHRPLNRSPLAITVLCFGGLLGTAMAAQDLPVEGVPIDSMPMDSMPIDSMPVEINAHALDAHPQSRIEGDKALDAALAAALVGAIASQFDMAADEVGIKLDQVAVEPASLRDRNVSGEGRLRIGDDSWIAFRFQALYDTHAASVSYPYLVLDDADAGRPLDPHSHIARTLDSHVDRSLAQEFAQQPVDLVIDRVTSAPAGERYLTVHALGTADFDGEGSTAAQVRALYDRQEGEWVRIDYELGATANWAEVAQPAIASR